MYTTVKTKLVELVNIGCEYKLKTYKPRISLKKHSTNGQISVVFVVVLSSK